MHTYGERETRPEFTFVKRDHIFTMPHGSDRFVSHPICFSLSPSVLLSLLNGLPLPKLPLKQNTQRAPLQHLLLPPTTLAFAPLSSPPLPPPLYPYHTATGEEGSTDRKRRSISRQNSRHEHNLMTIIRGPERPQREKLTERCFETEGKGRHKQQPLDLVLWPRPPTWLLHSSNAALRKLTTTFFSHALPPLAEEKK